MGTAHDYLSAILQRGRAPMEPKDFHPQWDDAPRRAKHYCDAERLPLPAAGADGAAGQGADGFTLPQLADLLQHSYGYLGRRLAPQANSDLPWLPTYSEANWWRGTASGGGLYPVSVYWVTGASGPVLPGVYHYAPQHHEMRRLLAGDVTDQVRTALSVPGAPAPAGSADSDQFLVLGVKYWQNAFKYSSFAYHVVSMDIGTVVHTWQLLAAERGLPALTPLLWFDEAALGRLLGVAAPEEGIFAVVPLPAGGRSREQPVPAAVAGGRPARSPAVRRRESERSRRVLSFPTVQEMAAATSAAPGGRPAPGALRTAVAGPPRPGLGPVVALPPASSATRPARDALRSRRSSFGRFSAAVPTELADLGAVLDAGTAAAAFPTDVAGPPAGGSLTKLYAFVNHVRGVPPGTYEYDPAQRRLLLLDADPPGPFLQSTYFLENYNVEQVGAVLVPTLRAAAVLDAVGDRGYRLGNAVIGAVSQGVYTAAASVGLGCGAALGFDNVAYAEHLGLTGTDEAPLLVLMVGHERARPGDFTYRIA
jgi:SagB-type dehydrogenase family enzyme